MKYLVVEVQTSAEGAVGTIPFSFNTKDEADAKYHTLLAVASVSNVPIHCVYMLSNDGHFLNSESHFHNVEPALAGEE